jgi:choline dehydrogenase-like flavoprotein
MIKVDEVSWNLESEAPQGLNGRNMKLTRGKFLGGSSGIKGTLCIPGTRQDYDSWGLDGWSGDEMFSYMRKVIFLDKPLLCLILKRLTFP